MSWGITAMTAGIAATIATVAETVVSQSRLGPVAAFGHTFSCGLALACALDTLMDPRESGATKLAAIAVNCFATMAVSQITRYSQGINYRDLENLHMYEFLAMPVAIVAARSLSSGTGSQPASEPRSRSKRALDLYAPDL